MPQSEPKPAPMADPQTEGVIDKWIVVTSVCNTETWAVPIDVIAMDRARNYADEFDGDVIRSLAEDTAPLFEECPYEAIDWARNNMNWSEVVAHARRVEVKRSVDYQEMWCNGDADIVDDPFAFTPNTESEEP